MCITPVCCHSGNSTYSHQQNFIYFQYLNQTTVTRTAATGSKLQSVVRYLFATKMNQDEYSKYTLDNIKQNFPQVSFITEDIEDGSLDLLLSSSKGLLTIWIGTFNKEITIGLDDPQEKSYWHTHMPLFGSYDVDEQNSFLNIIA